MGQVFRPGKLVVYRDTKDVKLICDAQPVTIKVVTSSPDEYFLEIRLASTLALSAGGSTSSSMKMENRRGPRIEPCGTEALIEQTVFEI